MKAWLHLLGGLLLWAVHFFALYIVGSLYPGGDPARLVGGAVTLVCLAAAALLTASAWRRRAAADEPMERWSHLIAALGGAGALVAILWQGLPVLLL